MPTRSRPTELAELQSANVEAQVELLALHAAELGHDKVAQFVNEDDDPRPTATMRMTTLKPITYDNATPPGTTR